MHINHSIIVIPARYASTRLPGKPLIKIAGKTLLQHVCAMAMHAAQQIPNVSVLVATDDERIMQHANDIGVAAVMTPASCASGSDRVLAAIQQLPNKPKYVINLQGDAPLTPVNIITALLNNLKNNLVVTPVLRLSWANLDNLRTTKLTTPFSGTTVIFNHNNEAIWFSKQIIPALRDENKLRNQNTMSPIYQHLGIYGYAIEMLEKFTQLPPSPYERLEGLEQLRFLENGYTINIVPVALDNLDAWRGVDTIEDAKFVEQLLIRK